MVVSMGSPGGTIVGVIGNALAGTIVGTSGRRGGLTGFSGDFAGSPVGSGSGSGSARSTGQGFSSITGGVFSTAPVVRGVGEINARVVCTPRAIKAPT